MSTKSTKSMLSVYLLLILFLCTLGCGSTIPLIIKKALATDPNDIPVKTFRIMMDVDQHEELFTQLQKFSNKYSLKFGLSLFDADKISFLAAMYGDGFHITVVNAADSSPEKIRISFYNEASTPTAQGTVDELLTDLKTFLREIPNVTISDEK